MTLVLFFKDQSISNEKNLIFIILLLFFFWYNEKGISAGEAKENNENKCNIY